MSKLFQYIKKLFKNSSEIYSVRSNPWAGLSSYEDPDKASKPLLFTGREKESSEVFSLIDNNLLITLYGKSGIGKTSLLNAGVFPLLRDKKYFPVYIRLGVDNSENNLAKGIVNVIETSITDRYGSDSISSIEVLPEVEDCSVDSFLWSYFARHKFHNAVGEVIFPVIVFDQFEEVIRFFRSETSLLLKQISYLIDKNNAIGECNVDGEDYVYDYNFRFVISIREDDLYQLEDVINQHYLYSLKQCRYRVQNLSEACAKDVVKINGDACIDPLFKEEIADKLIEVSKGKEDGLISTNILSLVCSRLYDVVARKNKSTITLDDANEYIKGNPFDEYYSEAVHKLSESEKRFIESNLVTSDGRRSVISEEALAESVKSYEKLLSDDTKILHRIKRSNETGNSVELIHDGICPVVQNHRAVRLEKKNYTVYNLYMLIVGVLSLWMLNKTIVNDFVYFFLKVANIDYRLQFVDVLPLSQLIAILLYPIAIGAAVFNLNIKRKVAYVLGAVYLIPILFFPATFYKTVEVGLCNFYEAIRLGISASHNLLSKRALVFLLWSAMTLALTIINFNSKRGFRRSENALLFLFKNAGSLLFYWAIAIFLFYKSIDNQAFINESFDSAWGLLVIPLLTLFLTGFHGKSAQQVKWLIVYVVILSCLVAGAYMEFFPSIAMYFAIIVLSFIVLIFCNYDGSLIRAGGKAIINAILLSLVIFANCGYNLLKIDNSTVSKVYPWKIVRFFLQIIKPEFWMLLVAIHY